MKRRDFLFKSALAVFGFAVLPSAVTYKRTWKKTEALYVPNPAWEAAPYEVSFITAPWVGKPEWETWIIPNNGEWKFGTQILV